MNDLEIVRLFDPLLARFATLDRLAKGPPLLAHYTSIRVAESILKNSEVWFSNPLFMNDLQEMRFGLNEGSRLFADTQLQKRAGGTDARAVILNHSYFHYFNEFDNNQALDIYVFCLTEHDRNNTDGLLSMWRGYGQHGNGVALVFDSGAVTMVPTSPLIIAKVYYGSDEERRAQLQAMLDDWAAITQRASLPDEKLHLAAFAALLAIKTFALTTKHKGFSEEAEWRVIYYPERDSGGALKKFMGYHIGEHGVEPKLKYPVGHIEGVSAMDLALERLLERIIMGPSHSSLLARKSVERMLETIGKPQFKPKLHASGIPLRPTSGGSF
jgi:hypothetical protein